MKSGDAPNDRTPTSRSIVEVARALKPAMPGVWMVYGGVYPTYHAQEILWSHPHFDVIVRGEGEATSPQLLAAVASGASLASVPGIAYREAGVPRLTQPAPGELPYSQELL